MVSVAGRLVRNVDCCESADRPMVETYRRPVPCKVPEMRNLRRKLIVLTVTFTLAVGMAIPASAATYVINGATGPSPKTLTIDPSNIAECFNGTTWHVRSYTRGFGPFDSTGTTEMRWQKSNGANYVVYRTGEHDIFTWTWDTRATRMNWFKVTYLHLSSVGDATFTAFCS